MDVKRSSSPTGIIPQSTLPLREMSSSCDRKNPNIAFLPSAGMGHLKPFCSLAAALSERGCDVSFITVHPTVSAAESSHISDFLAAFPRIRRLDFDLVAFDPSSVASTDPFFLHVEAIRRSANLLPALLAASSPPFSALIIDIFLASTFIPFAAGTGLPTYIQFISTAAMLSLLAYFPTCIAGVSDFEIPGLWRVPKASIPRVLHDPSHPFTIQFVENSRILSKASGILVNTFEALEPEALAALKRGKVAPGLPPVIAIGPLQAPSLGEGSPLPWLHGQPARSVIYVCFGNRTAMSNEQIGELAIGLEKSGCSFLWVVKSKKVDREDEEVELDGLLGEGYLERVKDRGLVVKEWVDQEEILRHRAIGGFLSHCGANSVFEAALHGVRVLGWPSGGDQRVNAEVVARSGLGIWVKEWSWVGEEEVVMGEEIGERVRQLMEDEGLQASAARLREEAVKAVAVDGSSGKGFAEFIGMLKIP